MPRRITADGFIEDLGKPRRRNYRSAGGLIDIDGETITAKVFLALFTDATIVGDLRWEYPFVEVDAVASHVYQLRDDGRTGTAYSTLEAMNQSTPGVQSGGVDTAGVSFPSDSMGPVPIRGRGPAPWDVTTGPIVVLAEFSLISGQPHYVILGPTMNAIDGACSPPAP